MKSDFAAAIAPIASPAPSYPSGPYTVRDNGGTLNAQTFDRLADAALNLIALPRQSTALQLFNVRP